MIKKVEKTQGWRVASDIHLDGDVEGKKFNPESLWRPKEMENDKNTTLILAGDLWESNKIISFHGTCWIEDVAKQFQYVIIVLGNHDYYGGRLGREASRLKEGLAQKGIQNVHVLDNEVIKVGDVKVIGTTLWSSFNQGNELSLRYANEGYPNERGGFRTLNDMKYIRNETFRKVRAQELMREHRKSILFLNQVAKRESNQEKVLIISHHAPSIKAIPEEWKFEAVGDLKWHEGGAYASDLEEEKKHWEIDCWIHGHTHEAKQYDWGGTPVLVNPRGHGKDQIAKTGFNEYCLLDHDLKFVNTYNDELKTKGRKL